MRTSGIITNEKKRNNRFIIGMEYFKQRNLVFFCFSLFFHSLLVCFIYLTPQSKISKPDRTPSSLLIMKVVDKKDLLDESTLKQIVEQNTDLSYIQNSAAKNAKFLSKYHQKVPKETRSKKTRSLNKKSVLINSHQNTLLQKTLKQKKVTVSQRKVSPPDVSVPNVSVPDISVADLIPKMDWNQYMNVKKIDTRKQLSEKKEDIHLTNQLVSEFQSDDYLKDIEEGRQTLLNTKAFRFYTYYRRIKEQVQTSWKSMVKEEIRRLLLQQRESILGVEQKTSLLITLDRFGALVDIQILKKSHVAILDHIAIQSFQLTAPFPHPPKGLIGEKKFLQIRWDFILERIV